MSTQRSWLYVLLGLLISSFLGGAIHVIFSPQRVQEFIEGILRDKEPKFSIQFDSAQFLLADGIWPLFAVEFRGLRIKAKDTCITKSIISADRFIVPVQVMALVSKKLRFGHIRAENLQFVWIPSNCESHEPVEESADEITPFERFFQKRWNKEIVNTTRFLDELSFNKLNFYKPDGAGNELSAQPLFQISNLSINFSAVKGLSRVQFNFLPGNQWIGDTPLSPFAVNMDITADGVHAEGEGNLKEGWLVSNGDWHVENGKVDLKLQLNDLPLQQVIQLSQHWGILQSIHLKIKNQWVNCRLNLHSDIRALNVSPVRMDDCHFYGDLGDMVITSKEFTLKEPYPLKMGIANIDNRKLLQIFNVDNNWGVVSDFGRLNGEFELNAANKFALTGVLQSVDLFLANLKEHSHQKVNEAEANFEFFNGNFSGRVDHFSIENGSFKGVARVNFQQSGSGSYKVDADEIQVSHAIQGILTGGLFSNLSVHGGGELSDMAILGFAGQINLASLQTQNWLINNIATTTNYRDGTWQISAKAGQFSLRPESKWAPSVNMISVAVKSDDKFITFQNISSDFTVSDSSGSWKFLNASVGSGHEIIYSFGEWDSKNGLNGSVGVKMRAADKPLQVWSLTGNWQQPNLSSGERETH